MSFSPQNLQRAQYEIPYHYFPHFRNGCFQDHRFWNWGMQYMGGLEVVLKQLKEIEFSELLDVGCGDGRFLKEVSVQHSDPKLVGVDISNKALRFARAFNENLEFLKQDITKDSLNEQFEVVTLIEVLEHIKPDHISCFIKGVSDSMKNKGIVIITVPHENQPLIKKHYQHFTGEKLIKLLSPYFEVTKIIPFDKRSLMFRFLQLLMGKKGRNYLITNPKLNQWLYGWYRKNTLYQADESNCSRLLAVATKQ